MSLKHARSYQGELPRLPAGPPYPCSKLDAWIGCPFWLEPSDARLSGIHHGHAAPTPALENLEGMVHYWVEHPEWMDMLDPDSPVHMDKIVERAIYLDAWEPYLERADRILDVGGGVGRIAQWLLKRGAEVQIIDPDLRSLWRAVSHAAGGKGLIDVHWSTAERMPDLGLFDTVIACELLNYVEDPALCLQRMTAALKPGGHLLLSVEARWGWAMSRDVAVGTIDAFLETGIVHVPHDLRIRTYTRQQLEDLLEGLEIIDIHPSHYCLSGPFEMIAGELSIAETLGLENKLRSHPVAENLNRAWIAVAKKG